MTSGTRELPEWINLGALTTPEEIALRETLVARGIELLPALTTWIRDAAPLAERPPLLEVVDDTRELIYAHMGITALADAVDRLRELVAVFEASGSELDNRVNNLEIADTQTEPPAGDILPDRGADELAGNNPVAVGAESRGTGRWRNRP